LLKVWTFEILLFVIALIVLMIGLSDRMELMS